ncbi:MAG: amino acid permease [Rhabdochlamydiaceae bacterium]|nr:amino acid permease [Rhabdochlamydiaceae bacterium]
MAKKLHFRSVVALVIGSQIGSGIFLLPTSLAPFGAVSLFGWLTSGIGALLLALVFAQLSMRISKGGGPHVYIEKAFGRKAAFFTAWTYWIISWASSIAVIVAAIGYLSSLVHISGPLLTLGLEIAIVTAITAINIRSASLAGSCEIFLTFLKCAPLIIIPFAGFFFIKAEHFTFPEGPSFFSSLNASSVLAFWGFIGLETATTAAGIIDKPTQTIPRAVILGTAIVAGIYFLNSFSVMGILPSSVLINSQAPYVEAAKVMFGGSWHCMIALAAFISCIGTLNAWVLTSGQIAAEAAKEGLFPSFFAKANKSGSPYISLLIALVCTQILLFLTLTPNILQQLNTIIDLSVSIFLFIYMACGLAFLKMLFKKQIHSEKPKLYGLIAILACLFCVWVLAFTSWENLLLCSLFVLSGVPIYLWRKKKLLKDVGTI